MLWIAADDQAGFTETIWHEHTYSLSRRFVLFVQLYVPVVAAPPIFKKIYHTLASACRRHSIFSAENAEGVAS